MTFNFTCTQCGQSLQAADSAAGTVISCPVCSCRLLLPSVAPAVGATIGGFHLKELIASDAAGEVFLAEQLSLGRNVALRILPSSIVGNAENANRFVAQLRATAKLEHPNLVRVYEVGQAGEVCFVAMEHIEGESLAARLAGSGALSEAESLAIVQSLATALSWAWQQHGLAHGDIQVARILIDRRDEPHLADMGMAGASTDFRGDMLALGLALHSMLAGKSSALRQNNPLPDPRKTRPNVTPGCVALLETLLAKNASDRYPGWEAFLTDLARVRKGGKPTQPTPARGQSWLQREAAVAVKTAPQPADSAAGVWGTLALVLLLIAGGVGALIYTGKIKWPPAFLSSLSSDENQPPTPISAPEPTPVPVRVEKKPVTVPSRPAPKLKPLTDADRDRINAALARWALDNPKADLKLDVNFNKDSISMRVLRVKKLDNLSALRGLPFKTLWLVNCPALRDISPLADVAALEELDLAHSGVTDLAPLRGLPIRRISVHHTKVSDLSPLAESGALEMLTAEFTEVSDLSPLRGLQIARATLRRTKIRDLSPLKGMPLEELSVSQTDVEDLSPLQGMPLKKFWAHDCPRLRDLSPLKDSPLTSVDVKNTQADIAPLQGIPTLKSIEK